MGNRLGLNGGEYDVLAIGDDDGPRATTISGIDQPTIVLGVLDNTFNWCRFRAHNRDDPIGGYDVAKSNVYEFNFQNYPPGSRRIYYDSTRQAALRQENSQFLLAPKDQIG